MKAAPSRRARRKMHIWPVALGLLLLIILAFITDPFHHGLEEGYIQSMNLISESDSRAD